MEIVLVVTTLEGPSGGKVSLRVKCMVWSTERSTGQEGQQILGIPSSTHDLRSVYSLPFLLGMRSLKDEEADGFSKAKR